MGQITRVIIQNWFTVTNIAHCFKFSLSVSIIVSPLSWQCYVKFIWNMALTAPRHKTYLQVKLNYSLHKDILPQPSLPQTNHFGWETTCDAISSLRSRSVLQQSVLLMLFRRQVCVLVCNFHMDICCSYIYIYIYKSITCVYPAWMNDHMACKVWDAITYPPYFPTFCKWISYLMPHYVMDVTTCLYRERGPCISYQCSFNRMQSLSI